MAWPSRFTIIIASVFYVLPCAALATSQQYMSAGAPHVFRYATVDDVDDIATVHVDAFSPAPEYGYFHQFRDKYPDADWECLRPAYRRVVVSKDFACKVIAVPDDSAPTGTRVVSFSIWDFNRTQRYGESSGMLTCNWARLVAPTAHHPLTPT
jgi:hypothetical protein